MFVCQVILKILSSISEIVFVKSNTRLGRTGLNQDSTRRRMDVPTRAQSPEPEWDVVLTFKRGRDPELKWDLVVTSKRVPKKLFSPSNVRQYDGMQYVAAFNKS